MRVTISKPDYLVINPEKHAGNFLQVKEYPFAGVFYRLMNHLSSRGFECGKCEVCEKHYKNLSKYNRQCLNKKKNMMVFLEIGGWGIGIKIGTIDNLMPKTSADFWPDWNSNYKAPDYLQMKRLQLEVNKMSEFLQGIGVHVDFSKKLTDEEAIFNDEATNTHIHGGAKNWEELDAYVENEKKKKGYFLDHNSKDAHDKELISGQEKYFYSYHHGNRMVKGIIHHHINNMWWVMVNGKRFNVASFRLFDFNPIMPMRKMLNFDEQISRLQKEITKASEDYNFERCISINNKLKSLRKEVAV